MISNKDYQDQLKFPSVLSSKADIIKAQFNDKTDSIEMGSIDLHKKFNTPEMIVGGASDVSRNYGFMPIS
jgi:hypothetical protein